MIELLAIAALLGLAALVVAVRNADRRMREHVASLPPSIEGGLFHEDADRRGD